MIIMRAHRELKHYAGSKQRCGKKASCKRSTASVVGVAGSRFAMGRERVLVRLTGSIGETVPVALYRNKQLA